MKPRIRITLTVDTLSHATTIANSINNRLVGKDLFENHGVNAFVDENGVNTVSAEIRFNGQADRDELKDWAKDQVQNHPQVKTWVLSASVVTHSCSHDDSDVKDCTTKDFLRWER